jgi:hypothetical protein
MYGDSLFAQDGKISAISDNNVVISLGESSNIKKGDIFSVIKEIMIKDKNGKIQFKAKKKVGTIKVSIVQPDKSLATIINGDNIKEGYLITPGNEDEGTGEITESKSTQSNNNIEPTDISANNNWCFSIGLLLYGAEISISNSFGRPFGMLPSWSYASIDIGYMMGATLSDIEDEIDEGISTGSNSGAFLYLYGEFQEALYARSTFGYNLMSSEGGIGLVPYTGIGLTYWIMHYTGHAQAGTASNTVPAEMSEEHLDVMVSIGLKIPIRISSSYLVPKVEMTYLPSGGTIIVAGASWMW